MFLSFSVALGVVRGVFLVPSGSVRALLSLHDLALRHDSLPFLKQVHEGVQRVEKRHNQAHQEAQTEVERAPVKDLELGLGAGMGSRVCDEDQDHADRVLNREQARQCRDAEPFKGVGLVAVAKQAVGPVEVAHELFGAAHHNPGDHRFTALVEMNDEK